MTTVRNNCVHHNLFAYLCNLIVLKFFAHTLLKIKLTSQFFCLICRHIKSFVHKVT